MYQVIGCMFLQRMLHGVDVKEVEAANASALVLSYIYLFIYNFLLFILNGVRLIVACRSSRVIKKFLATPTTFIRII